jgi:predicted ATP-grasp superfamily ATP-dependent carboligase
LEIYPERIAMAISPEKLKERNEKIKRKIQETRERRKNQVCRDISLNSRTYLKRI